MEFYVANKNHVSGEHLKKGEMFSVHLCDQSWSCQEVDGTLKWGDGEEWLFTKDWARIKETKDKHPRVLPSLGSHYHQQPGRAGREQLPEHNTVTPVAVEEGFMTGPMALGREMMPLPTQSLARRNLENKYPSLSIPQPATGRQRVREPTDGVHRGQLPRTELDGGGWSVDLKEQLENTQHNI